MDARSKVGVVIFDTPDSYNPNEDNPGWRCLPGGEPVRVHGTGELPTNVRWLTNVAVDISALTQLRNSPRLLNERYLRTTVRSLVGELGLKERPGSEQAYVMAKIFSNVSRLAASFYGIAESPKHSFASALPGILGHYQVKPTGELAQAALSAFQTYVECERGIPGDQHVFTSVVLPRLRHAKELLDWGLPWGNWTRYVSGQLPAASERLAWLLGLETPAIARIQISRVHKSINQLLNYGAGAGSVGFRNRQGSRYQVLNDRSYATAAELAAIAQYADIDIEEVWISDQPAEARYALPTNGRLERLSFSYGLLCENLWTSLARDERGDMTRSPLSAWLHSLDRMRCLQGAMSLKSRGYQITGYGYGRITLFVPRSACGQFVRDAAELGLLSPVGFAASETVKIPSNPTAEDFQIALHWQGNLAAMMQLDDQFVSAVEAKFHRGVCANG